MGYKLIHQRQIHHRIPDGHTFSNDAQYPQTLRLVHGPYPSFQARLADNPRERLIPLHLLSSPTALCVLSPESLVLSLELMILSMELM